MGRVRVWRSVPLAGENVRTDIHPSRPAAGATVPRCMGLVRVWRAAAPLVPVAPGRRGSCAAGARDNLALARCTGPGHRERSMAVARALSELGDPASLWRLPFEVVGVAARLVRGTAQPGRMSVTTAIGHDPKWRQRYGRTRRGREPQPPRLGRLTGSTWSCRWTDSLRQTRARICGSRCGTSPVCMELNLPPIRGVARPVFCIGIRWGVAGRRQ
jgi:hypothetical protein